MATKEIKSSIPRPTPRTATAAASKEAAAKTSKLPVKAPATVLTNVEELPPTPADMPEDLAPTAEPEIESVQLVDFHEPSASEIAPPAFKEAAIGLDDIEVSVDIVASPLKGIDLSLVY